MIQRVRNVEIRQNVAPGPDNFSEKLHFYYSVLVDWKLGRPNLSPASKPHRGRYN